MNSDNLIDRKNLIKMLDSSLDGFVIYKNSKLNYISPKLSEITEYSREEIKKFKNTLLLLHDSEKKRIEEIIKERELSKKHTSHYETKIVTKTGRIVPVEVRTFEIKNEDQSLLMVSYKDLSKQQRRLRELEQLYLSQGKLFTEIAHSLKTPFTIINGLIELNMSKDMDPVYKDLLEMIKKEVGQASVKVTNLLDIAKHDLKDYKIEPRLMNTKEFINAAYIKGKALGYKYCILNHSSDCPCFILTENKNTQIYIDPEAIMDVLMTIIENAYTYSPKRGKAPNITMTATTNTKSFIIKISDKGKGIDKSKQKILFEHFSSIRRFSEGHGIGLPMSKRIVTAHNGSIKVSSKLNVGTTFTVKLPLAK